MLKASDLMTRDVATIRGSATVADTIRLMQERGWRALVVDRRHEQDAYGMVTEADIVYQVMARGRDPKKVRVYEIMTKPCIVVNPDLGVEYVARLFAENGLLQAPVIQGDLLGIISLSDILSCSEQSETSLIQRLEQDLQIAIGEARQACSVEGSTSDACLSAWDRVDRLQAEIAHHKQESIEKTAFEEFCEQYPEVMETQLFEAWCSG
jgi:CBS domain-containing protein